MNLSVFFSVIAGLIYLTSFLSGCSGEASAAPGYCQEEYKCPAAQEHPQVLQANEHIWQPTAVAATATHAAGAAQAASYAATMEAVQTLLPPATPTLAPERPKDHPIVPGDTFQLIMRGIGGCTMDEVAKFNDIQNINQIQVGDTIEWPENCYLVGK